MDNFNPSITLERSEGPIHDLFFLTEEQQKNLREKIRRNNGAVRIMIHPYYVQQKYLTDKDIKKYFSPGRVGVVEEGFKRLLRTKTDVPIFLFEAYDQIDNTKSLISQNIRDGNEIYIVPTFSDDSLPYFGKRNNLTGEEWKEFAKIIKNLGVEKIIIGGMYLMVGEDMISKKGSQFLNGCVGVAINNLKGSFNIQVSSLTGPDSRKDINTPDLRA